MCGEKPVEHGTPRPAKGSPPRMRGKECLLGSTPNPFGITPACAGKSHPGGSRKLLQRDHPRVCGEKKVAMLLQAAVSGSPPRMRGKVKDALLDCPQRGITPAYAGKSHLRKPYCELPRDHPRVCGEKASNSPIRDFLMGSPPRMRGKVSELRSQNEAAGITPAYAGKSRARRTASSTSWDHPRVCGEKFLAPWPLPMMLGSPPRMRGKGPDPAGCSTHTGITPAYAGKSMGEGFLQARKGDHPRVCGEKPFLFYGGSSDSGSSPRVRGKVFGRVRCYRAVGITPACAGKSR